MSNDPNEESIKVGEFDREHFKLILGFDMMDWQWNILQAWKRDDVLKLPKNRNRVPSPGDVDLATNKLWDGVKWIPLPDFWSLCRIWNGSGWLTKEAWIEERRNLGETPAPRTDNVPMEKPIESDTHRTHT